MVVVRRGLGSVYGCVCVGGYGWEAQLLSVLNPHRS